MQNSPTWADRSFIPLLLLITVASLLLRVVPLYDHVITPETVRFQTIDPYYHVRLTKYVVEHFPRRMTFDSLRLHPGGQKVDVYPAYDLLNASLALAVGLGSPSERTTEEVTAWTPALLGAATVWLVGLAGRCLGGPWVGVAAAIVAGSLPGGTLTQTVLGYSDHHALESFLLAAAWWILMVLVRGQRTQTSRLIWSIWLGIVGGLYVMTWEGSPILPAAVALIMAVRTWWTQTDVEGLWLLVREGAGTATSAAAVVVAMWFLSPMVTTSLTLFFLVPMIPLSMLLVRRIVPHATPVRSGLVWVLGGLAAMLALVWLLPERLSHALWTNVQRLDPSPEALTVGEMRQLINQPDLLWQFYGASLGWVVIGFVAGVRMLLRERDGRLLVALVVGALFIPSSLLQIRFSSSASLAIALIVGWVAGVLLEAGARRTSAWRRSAAWIALAAWMATVGVWSAIHAPEVARGDRGPSPEWVAAMAWLKHEPRRSADGVLNWWDSGYYITTLAGRAPTSNPSQSGARSSALAFLDTTGEAGVRRLSMESIGTIIVDASLALRPISPTKVGGDFSPLLVWAGKSGGDYIRPVYFPGPGGTWDARFAYTPAYYRSLLIRLMLFDGKAVEPAPRAAWALKLRTQIDQRGLRMDVVESSRSFSSAAAAEAFFRNEADDGWILVGFSPFDTCVPLDEVGNVRLAHASPSIAFNLPSLPHPVPRLKVFQILSER